MAKNGDKESYVYKAKLAEQAERYDEMRNYMKLVAEMANEDLSVEERNLLSVAYKNVIGQRRASWRILSTIETKELDKDPDQQREASIKSVQSLKAKVEAELEAICKDVLEVLDKSLIPNVGENFEAKVFYQKMKGDYHRYKAEFVDEDEKKQSATAALKSYQEAQACAEKELKATNAIRLGLALNFSVFYYEINNKPSEACKLAKSAFDSAIADLDSLPEDSYKDSTLIMQLLRDNLTLWTSDMQTDEAEGPVEVQDLEEPDAS